MRKTTLLSSKKSRKLVLSRNQAEMVLRGFEAILSDAAADLSTIAGSGEFYRVHSIFKRLKETLRLVKRLTKSTIRQDQEEQEGLFPVVGLSQRSADELARSFEKKVTGREYVLHSKGVARPYIEEVTSPSCGSVSNEERSSCTVHHDEMAEEDHPDWCSECQSVHTGSCDAADTEEE